MTKRAITLIFETNQNTNTLILGNAIAKLINDNVDAIAQPEIDPRLVRVSAAGWIVWSEDKEIQKEIVP